MRKYKLLIVDDEVEVRKGIIEKIDWNFIGFEIVGEAENGKEALEVFEKTLPDVLITDINMPFMNGLELSSIIREKYPTTKIILITGYDEFEYAHKAIKLNVLEYILRPISSSELTEILIKIKNKIDNEIAEKENIEALREYFRKSLPILKEKFLVSLITSTLTKEEIEEKSKSYNIDLSGKNYMVSIVSIDFSSNQKDFKEEKELWKFSVLNIVEEIIIKYNLGVAFINNETVVIISKSDDYDRNKIIEMNFNALEELRQTIEKFLKFTVTIGIGNLCNDITKLNQSYQNAVAALDYKIFMGNNRIIWIEDIEPKSADKVVFDELKERSLESSIKVGTLEEISDTIDKLFKEISDFKVSFKDYQIYVMEMLTTILKVARNSDIDINDIFGSNHNLFIELYSLNTIEEVQNWFKNISIKIRNYIIKGRQDTANELVEKAKEYVKEHYKESDININKVCTYLHISPNYFSFIFKRETKTTFINYLTHVRMEKAKELLRTTNMKTFEIAENVGYSEPNYFSYSFKKRFNLSPSEYRSSIK
ncbi:two-component system, response regulator YesN [Clostridium sp. USBA 49]|uniref:response regulator n=1 Tax=Clostridium sp. USBA 49 TaxID=1881060 RepID=UPI0009999F90|nr:response regulator [Clostridium sp. USBA 49]SKA72996.1 two-component system, response regulator YesN [Clostridium sp. USBA 49]